MPPGADLDGLEMPLSRGHLGSAVVGGPALVSLPHCPSLGLLDHSPGPDPSHSQAGRTDSLLPWGPLLDEFSAFHQLNGEPSGAPVCPPHPPGDTRARGLSGVG